MVVASQTISVKMYKKLRLCLGRLVIYNSCQSCTLQKLTGLPVVRALFVLFKRVETAKTVRTQAHFKGCLGAPTRQQTTKGRKYEICSIPPCARAGAVRVLLVSLLARADYVMNMEGGFVTDRYCQALPASDACTATLWRQMRC